MQRRKRTKEKTLLSEWRSLLKKDLTGPTLLEMSGFRVNQALARDNTLNRFGKSQGIRTGGTKGERRSATSQAPPLLRQRKPYLTGSPPSRQERRCRQEVAWPEYTAGSPRCQNKVIGQLEFS